MKLAGLGNNLGLKLSAPKARDAKSLSSEKSPSSFEDSLGVAKSDAKPMEPKAGEKTPLKDKAASEPKELNVSADESDLQSESIPGQASAPSLNGPIQDRVLNANPVDPVITGSLLKQPAAKTQDEGVDSLTRRVVWNDFLRKMKDDLGVDAEDVLKAFASLTDEELAQPPQETVNSVVSALGLDNGQSALARQYFTELVDKTKSKSMGEELETSGRQINLTLMSQREMQRKSLAKSLDAMNKNFFMKNPQAAKALAQVQEQGPTQEQRGDKASLIVPEGMIPAGSASFASPMEGLNAPALPIPAPAPGSPMAALDKLNAKPKALKGQENTVDEMVRQFLSPQAKLETLKAGEMTAAPMAALPTAAPAVVHEAAAHAPNAAAALATNAVPVDGLKGILQDLAGSGDSSDDDGDGEYTSDASYLNQALGNQDHLKAGKAQGAEFQGELAKAGAPQPMTVPELVDKAQIMLHDGGGEMKVTMSPDGLGEVAMRVSVSDGKVQVQMITESDEAKRLIERHMGELKTQLTSNNLHVDNIKIDTASNLGKQLEQQYHDAQRQMAHQTLEQFRQDQQGWRRSFFEVPSAKRYKGQNEGLRDVHAPSSASTASRNKGGNRRLDLVA